MILTGFLLTFTGISLLFMLIVPNSTYVLFGPLILSTADPNLPGMGSMQDYASITNFIHVVEVVSFLLILGGLVFSVLGVFNREK